MGLIFGLGLVGGGSVAVPQLVLHCILWYVIFAFIECKLAVCAHTVAAVCVWGGCLGYNTKSSSTSSPIEENEVLCKQAAKGSLVDGSLLYIVLHADGGDDVPLAVGDTAWEG
jgi:hypothetical protein